MQCLAQLDRVLARNAVPAEPRASLLAALRGARDPRRLRQLLLAHHPRRAAFLAAFDGHITVRRADILLAMDPLPPSSVLEPAPLERGLTGAHACHVRGTWQSVYRFGPLADRRVLVADGAQVTALTPLTDGPVDLHDVLMILGDAELNARLLAELADAIGEHPDGLDLVVPPMRSLVELTDPGASGLPLGARISRAAFDRLLGQIPQRTLRALAADQLPPVLAALLDRDPADLFDRFCEPDVVDAWNTLVDRHGLPPFPQWPVARALWTGVDVLDAHVDPV